MGVFLVVNVTFAMQMQPCNDYSKKRSREDKEVSSSNKKHASLEKVSYLLIRSGDEVIGNWRKSSQFFFEFINSNSDTTVEASTAKTGSVDGQLKVQESCEMEVDLYEDGK